MTEDVKADQESDEKVAEALDLARGDLNPDDLNDLEEAIDEIDFAARRTAPECLARLKGLSARLVDLIEQIEKGIRKPSPEGQLTPEQEKEYDALVEKGVAAAEKGDYETARQSLEAAVRLDPNELSGLYDLGVVYGKLGENPKDPYYATSHGFDEIYAEKAAFCFERVLELDPKHAQALTNLAAIHDVRGETDAAIECLKKALEIDPNEAKAREHLKELQESTGKK